MNTNEKLVDETESYLVSEFCENCNEELEPEYDNNGFNEPGAEHLELVGFKTCKCEGRTE